MAKTIRGPSALAHREKAESRAHPGDTVRSSFQSSPAETATPSEPEIVIGMVLKEKYELVKPLAAGAMGTVYEAKHLALPRKFAIKMLSIDSRQQADALPRFKREAELASAIGHENIVDIVDIDRTDDDQWYIVMELLEGRELRELMFRRKKLTVDDVVILARQLGSAIDAAHDRGIVHRDLKPENIFVLDRKEPNTEIFVKIVDFGISKVRNATLALTRPGEVVGTPYYMAPEQARGDQTIDHRADLFALGAVFYEALTGKAPFRGETPNKVLRSILLDEVPAPKEINPELSDAVCRVLEKALAKQPDDRYQSGVELAQALERAAASAKTGELDHSGEVELEEARKSNELEQIPERATAPAPIESRGGYRAIHLMLAFIAGVIVCAGIVFLVMKTLK